MQAISFQIFILKQKKMQRCEMTNKGLYCKKLQRCSSSPFLKQGKSIKLKKQKRRGVFRAFSFAKMPVNRAIGGFLWRKVQGIASLRLRSLKNDKAKTSNNKQASLNAPAVHIITQVISSTKCGFHPFFKRISLRSRAQLVTYQRQRQCL